MFMLNLRSVSHAAAVVCLLAVPGQAQSPGSADNGDELDFFERKIRPILVARCYECHSGDSKSPGGSLRLDSRDGMLTGGDSGPAVVPGEPEKSLLLQAISYQSELVQMPPNGKLPEAEIRLLTEWLKRGAMAPDAAAPAASAKKTIDFEQGRKFWSFQPVREHALPPVRDAAWPRERIDHFLLARIEAAGLEPSPEADGRTLLRRAYFDVIGLPPSAAEVEAFVRSDSPGEYERAVERLLSSPH
jgi:hypothetical protein